MIEEQTKHECCIYCHKECLCSSGSACGIPLPECDTLIENQLFPQQERVITSEQKCLLQELLQDYKLQLSSGLLSFLGPECTTQFSDTLVKRVVKHTKFIFNKRYILDNLPVFKNEHAMDILCMIYDVFEDVDEKEIDRNLDDSQSSEYISSTSYDLAEMYEELLDECFEEGEQMSDEEDY